MNQSLWWLLQHLLVTALLIILVSGLCRLLRRYPAVQHALWLVVLVKFLLPPAVFWPWTMREAMQPMGGYVTLPSALSERMHRAWGNFSAVLPYSRASQDGHVEGEFDLSVIGLPEANSQSAYGEISAPQPQLTGSALLADNYRFTRFDALRGALIVGVAIWLIGCGIVALRQIRLIARHWNLIQQGKPARQPLAEKIGIVARQLGLRPLPALVVTGISSPFVWCLGRLRLIWPETLLSDEQLSRSRGIMAHELAHVRRRDHWVAWLELAGSIIWWWNPLFWFVRRKLRESAELACDALALGTCEQNRRAYAEMLLELSASTKTGAPVPVLGVSTGARHSLERRLSMILTDRVSGKVSHLGLIAAGCLALMAFPAWSLGQRQSGEQSPSVPTRASEQPEIAGGIDAPQDGPALRGRTENPHELLETILRSLLPRECAKAIPENVRVSTKACVSCHSSTAAGAVDEGATVGVHDAAIEERVKKLEAAIQELTRLLEQQGAVPGRRGSTRERPWIKGAASGIGPSGIGQPELPQGPLGSAGGQAELPRRSGVDQAASPQRPQIAPGGGSDDSPPSDKARLEQLEKAIDDLRAKVDQQRAGRPAADSRTRDLSALPTGEDLSNLGVRYLDAIAELQSARLWVSRLNTQKSTASEFELRHKLLAEIDNAEVGLKRAAGNEQLMTALVKDALKTAQAALDLSKAEVQRIKQLVEKGAVSTAELDAARARLLIDEARVKQFETILSLRGTLDSGTATITSTLTVPDDAASRFTIPPSGPSVPVGPRPAQPQPRGTREPRTDIPSVRSLPQPSGRTLPQAQPLATPAPTRPQPLAAPTPTLPQPLAPPTPAPQRPLDDRPDRTGNEPRVPIKVGELVIFAEESEPAVLAVDTQSGRVAWKMSLKGSQLAGPIHAEGDTVWIASGDGTIKRMNARSGELVEGPAKPDRH